MFTSYRVEALVSRCICAGICEHCSIDCEYGLERYSSGGPLRQNASVPHACRLSFAMWEDQLVL